MEPEGTSFSSQRLLEKLCGKDVNQSIDESVQGQSGGEVKPTKTAKPPLYALIIGISDYLKHTNLKGAVNDANTFKSYLVNDLSVPEDQITSLFDSQATRDAIITAFKNLITDQRINRDDPIVIFYAGHGAEVLPPPNRQINGPMIQCVVPHDASQRTDSAKEVHPIPDFTISALLGKLAKAKGNNITVIFDCCHAADGTRTYEVDARGRSIFGINLSPLPDNIDSDIVEDGSITILNRMLVDDDEEISVQAMGSHVLLAACGHSELAYENHSSPNNHGFFTEALLDILRSGSVDKLTYKGCIQRFPKLRTPRYQSPVCEGANVDRIFFNAMVPGANSSFILIKTNDDQHYLQAGTAQGITPGCTFAVHADLIFDPSNPSIGTLVAAEVKPFQSLLRFPEGASTFDIPQPAYARQNKVGSEQVLDIFVTRRFEDAAVPDPRWEQLFSGGEDQVLLRLTEQAQAQVVIDVDDRGHATFTLMKLKEAIAHGIQQIPHTVPPTFDCVQLVLPAMAYWNWHLLRTPPTRPFQKAVEMEFYKLEESGEYDYGQPIYRPQGTNLNQGGEADIIVGEDDHYGFHITNKSTRDLYAYMLYFSIPEQTIHLKFTRVFGSGKVDPSLPREASLTLGFGSGGVAPLKFWLGDRDIDVGIFKLFVTTTPIDLDPIKQSNPFIAATTRASATDEEVDAILEQKQLWDSLTMTLVQRRDPTLVSPVVGTKNPTEAPEDAFSRLSVAEQNTILQNAGFNHGIRINPSGFPSPSNQLAAALLRPVASCARATETIIVESSLATTELDALHALFGLPPLHSLLDIPWIRERAENPPGPAAKTPTWTTRRLQVSRVVVDVSLSDLQPAFGFQHAVRTALSSTQDPEKFKAMRNIFAIWGDVVPLTIEIGAALAVTGVVAQSRRFGNWASRRRKPQSIGSFITHHLGAERPFEGPISARVQGGQLLALEDGHDAWDTTIIIGDFRQWGMVKVTQVAPIVDLLENDLRREVYDLYARLIFRSPQVGVSRQLDFDCGADGSQAIQQIVVGFSNSHIKRISISYPSSLITYHAEGHSTDCIGLGIIYLYQDEGITDMFVWATDQMVTSLQFVKNTGWVSPIYGRTRGVTKEPVLMSGNGSVLVGLSGSLDAEGITQIQAIWRGDVSAPGYRRLQTSFAGGSDGIIFNDLELLDNPLATRIVQITARAPGTNFVGGLQVTYTDNSGATQETPVHGTENGQTTTWCLEKEEYITGVRGRHDGTSICELKFTTNRNRESPAFGMPAGNNYFSFNAPKTDDGNEMVLQYMVGKSDERVNSIMFIWAEPVKVFRWSCEVI